MPEWLENASNVILALILLVLNGFFVASEFALVKVRGTRLEQLVLEKRPFAKSARWLADRMEGSLSVCQLGITMASLALGWVGEPAFAHLIEPLLAGVGITSPLVIHTISFIVAFGTITALHLVIGEQAPKIFAIREPEKMILWCAVPMQFFYLISFPLMWALNWTTTALLARIGLRSADSHESPLNEDEIRVIIEQAHLTGNVTRSEHRLINAVFEFDDMVCRRVMVPRADVDFFDIREPVKNCLDLARRTKHTRYPLCNGSLDETLGVVHIKDLVGISIDSDFDWNNVIRTPKKVPENMPISKLLRHFQSTHQLLAFVIDEFGNVIGIVTLENVLEQIIGQVDDEFDVKQVDIVPCGPGQFEVVGTAALVDVFRELKLAVPETEADTFSGYLMDLTDRILSVGDKIELGNAVAEVMEAKDDRASRVRVTLRSE